MADVPDLVVELDPPIDDELARRLIEMWVDVTNHDGAVGFVPPVGFADIEPYAGKAFEAVGRGESHLVVGKLGGQVVGFMFFEHRPGPLFRHWAELKRFQVAPAFQGRGVGSELLKAGLECARTVGLEQVRARVRGGTGYERFYVDHGFAEVARVPDAIRIAPGDDREEIYLMIRLRSATP